jgi:hypothetical protein
MGVLGRHLFELKGGRKGSENRGTKASFPCFLHVQRKKKTYGVVQNDTVLGLFFFNEQCMKRRRFEQNALFHLNENDSKLMSKSKSVFNL